MTDTMRVDIAATIDSLATEQPRRAVPAAPGARTTPRRDIVRETATTPVLSAGSAGKRAQVYQPTPKAKPVERPTNTADKVLNLILSRHICTLPDLIKGTHKSKKAIYTALWQLGKDSLITTTPIAEMDGQLVAAAPYNA